MFDKEFLTVSELNGLIKEVLNMGFPSGVWVCGEIQGFNRNREKSHVFFELCEKDPVSKDVLARIGLVIFSGRKAYIQDTLRKSENAFELKDDIEVKFLCKVDFYPPHGAVRLVVESIDPTYTLGKIAQEKQRLIAHLKQKGTLDKNKQIALPWVSLHIGLITAYDSAAYNDFLSELSLSGYGFKIFCRNAVMQGKGTAPDICKAIDELSTMDELDVIVITRGGGSIADLSWFDSEAIAEKIAACRLPVLSGIGHEINITVTDLAAHTYQKTPTAIARFLVERVSEFLNTLNEKGAQVIELAQEKLAENRRNLKNAAQDLQGATNVFLKQHHQNMARRQEKVEHSSLQLLEKSSLALDTRKADLIRDIRSRFKAEHTRLNNFDRLLELVNPVNTLKRGFSITRLSNGKILRDIGQVKRGEKIYTSLVDGSVESSIDAISKERTK